MNDLCIYIGEDTPIMNGWVPEGIDGYKYDFINADAIQHRLSVKNGRFVLPGGIEYAALVLPPVNTMRPELLRRIEELVEVWRCGDWSACNQIAEQGGLSVL